MARHSIADGIPLAAAQPRGSAKARSQRPKWTKGTYPGTAEVEYSADELEVLRAADVHRQTTGKRFLTTCDIFRIIQSLGYRRP